MDIYSVSKRSGSKGKKSGNKDKKNTRRRIKRTKRMRTKRNSKRVSRRRNVKNIKRKSRRRVSRSRTKRVNRRRNRRVMRGGAPVFTCGDYKCLNSFVERDAPQVPFDGFFRKGTKPPGMCVHIDWTQKKCIVIKFNERWRESASYLNYSEELDDLYEYQYREKVPPQSWVETGDHLIITKKIKIDDFCVYGVPAPAPAPDPDPSPEPALQLEVLPAPSTFTGLDLARRDKPVVPEPVSISFPMVPDAIPASEPLPEMTVESVETPRVPQEKLRAVSAFASAQPETSSPISLSTLTKIATAFVSPFHEETVEGFADENGIPSHLRDNFRAEGMVAVASLIERRPPDKPLKISPEMLHFIISLRAFNTTFMIGQGHSKTRGNITKILRKYKVGQEVALSKFIKRLLNHVCGIKDDSDCDKLIHEIQSLYPAEYLKDSVLRFFTNFAYDHPID